jgi:OOP family OmpA-OmpF porin
MKKTILLCATTLFAAALLPMNSIAENKKGDITLTPFVGGHLFEGNQNVDSDAWSVGLGMGYNLTDHWTAEGVFKLMNTDEDTPDSNKSIDGRLYHVDALYHFNPTGKFVPYLAAGVCGITLDNNPDGPETSALVNYGAGLKYYFTEKIALRGDVRHLVTFDDHYNNMTYAVGLTFLLGNTEPVPEPEPFVEPVTVDSDGDGVTDDKDKCPGTSAGLAVDKDGCPLEITEEISIEFDVEFDFGKSDIRSIYKDRCGEACQFLKNHPNSIISVEGHTDSVGPEEYNMQLSLERAASVRQYLVDNFSVDPNRITAIGVGESRPIATNDTPEGRQQNRRVIGVIKTEVKEFKKK